MSSPGSWTLASGAYAAVLALLYTHYVPGVAIMAGFVLVGWRALGCRDQKAEGGEAEFDRRGAELRGYVVEIGPCADDPPQGAKDATYETLRTGASDPGLGQ